MTISTPSRRSAHRKRTAPKPKNIALVVVIEQDKDGYFAHCPALQGCYTQGETYDEALANIKDAALLHIEDRLANGESVRDAKTVSLTMLEIAA
jgi:predicted RNase H-like HicB family nuclease